ncbi:MAG: hypothetical protein K2I64_05340 [Muribaculaceae bacterium]|nr:hypothetical protein [Muribaculaceae bacterium]
MIKRISLLLVFISALAAQSLMAQPQCPPGAPRDPAKREQWFKEMRNNKHEFLIRELDLAPAQQAEFFAVYDRMEDSLMKLGEATRKAEMSVKETPDPTDKDYDDATNELFELKGREYRIEKDAQAEFSKILTKRQLFRLKGAERKFVRALMKHHRPEKPVQDRH